VSEIFCNATVVGSHLNVMDRSRRDFLQPSSGGVVVGSALVAPGRMAGGESAKRNEGRLVLV